MEQIQILNLSIEDFRELLSDIVKEHLKQFEKDPPEQLLTIKEVASRLKISIPTIYKYSEMGILTRHKIGERNYLLWSEILEAAKKIEPLKPLNP